MSRSLTKPAALELPKVLGVGTDGLAWCDTSPLGGVQCHQMDWPSDCDGASAAALWKASLRQRAWAPAQAITVCLSSGLVRHWLQTPPAGTRSLAELHAVASARASALMGGLPSESWLVSGAWDFQRPFVCTALATRWAPLLQAIQGTHRNTRTVHAFGLAYAHCDAALPKDGWLAILVGDGLQLMHRKDGLVTSLRSVALAQFEVQADLEAAVVAEWHREQLRTQEAAGVLHGFSVQPGAHVVSASAGMVPLKWEAHPALSHVVLDAKSADPHGPHAGSARGVALQGLGLLLGKVRNAL